MMNNKTDLENKALEVLCSAFYDAGYRKGVKLGVASGFSGMLIGAAVMFVIWAKEEGCFKKTENEE